MFARNPWSARVRRPRGLRRPRRAARRRGPATARSSWDATARSTIRPRSRAARPPLRTGRRRPRSLRRAAGPVELRAGRDAPRSSSSSARRRRASEARRADRALPDRRPRRGPARASTTHWDDVLGAVQVKTPDRSMDILLNRWLLYQTLACRVWARSAFYQAGGAYGFRDQLQDVMALAGAAPGARARSTSCAPRRGNSWRATSSTGGIRPPAAGVRTRISDDLLWLPYVVAHYRRGRPATARCSTRSCRSSKGRRSRPDSTTSYFQPTVSDERGTLFEHCARALDRSLAVGAHGLPLIGTGDWNDGMNRVGARGQGRERLARLVPSRRRSAEFAPLAERARRAQRAPRRWRAHAARAHAARSSARLGRRLVSPRATSTTARRSAPPRTTDAASTRSRSPGA